MTRSSFAARFEQRAPSPAESPAISGSPANLSLEAKPGFTETVAAARALIQRGASPSVARSVVERLAGGEAAAVALKHYDGALDRELAKVGVSAAPQEQNAHDLAAGLVKARERLKMSQEQFASATGLKLATLRNWEQARGRRDASTLLLLKMIATEPDLALKAAAKPFRLGGLSFVDERKPAGRTKMTG